MVRWRVGDSTELKVYEGTKMSGQFKKVFILFVCWAESRIENEIESRLPNLAQ